MLHCSQPQAPRSQLSPLREEFRTRIDANQLDAAQVNSDGSARRLASISADQCSSAVCFSIPRSRCCAGFSRQVVLRLRSRTPLESSLQAADGQCSVPTVVLQSSCPKCSCAVRPSDIQLTRSHNGRILRHRPHDGSLVWTTSNSTDTENLEPTAKVCRRPSHKYHVGRHLVTRSRGWELKLEPPVNQIIPIGRTYEEGLWKAFEE